MFAPEHPMSRPTTNSIFIIHPYRSSGTWVFDDESHGLVREPFVSGIPEMIDEFVQDVPDAANGFNLLFASNPFPGYRKKLRRTREEYGGNWYLDEETQKEGWLCPALFHYFDQAPDHLYARAEPSK
jgi:hypothetical protein